MKRKFLFPFLSFAVLVGLIIIYQIITSEVESQVDNTSEFNPIESVKFARWDSDVRLKGDYPRESLNLFFVSPPSFAEDIFNIILTNNKSIDIKNYTVTEGDSINDNLNLYTLLITIQPDDPNYKVEETITHITITNNENTKYQFPIGNIHVAHGNRSDFLRAHEGYTISYNDFTYEASLENPSNSKITLKDFYINNKNIQLKDLKINDQSFNDEVIIPPGEIVEVSSELTLKEGSKYDFYQITPTAEIEVQEEIKQVHLDSSFYELFNIDQDKIDSIMSRSN